MSTPTPRDLVYVQRLVSDVHFFADELWKATGLDKIAPLSWVEHDMIDWLAHGPARRGILAMRGIGKTTFGCVVTDWFHLRNPERKTLVINKAEDDAKKTVGLVRDWIDSVPFLATLAPRKGADLDNKDEFNTAGIRPNRQPTLRAIGIEGALPGNRAHEILVDDIEDKTNTETPESRAKIADRCGEFESILYPDVAVSLRRANDDPNAVIEIGTYHHEESVYLKEAAKGVVFRVYPIVYPTPRELAFMRHAFPNPLTGKDEIRIDLAPALLARLESGQARPGDIVLPHRFDEVNVARKRARGERYFQMQHMCIIGLGTETHYPLRLRDIMVMDLNPRTGPTEVSYGAIDKNGPTDILDITCVGFDNDRFLRPAYVDPKPRPWLGTKMWIDPSGQGLDKTGVAVVSCLNSVLFVHYCDGLPGGFKVEALTKLAQIARDHRVREIYIESNFAGNAVAELFRPVLKAHFLSPGRHPDHPDGWACTIIDNTKITHATGQKELRILGDLEPRISRHHVVFDRRVAENKDLQHQITHITRAKGCLREDGAIDALSGCFRAWAGALGSDPAEKAAQDRERDMEDEEDRIFNATPRFLREGKPRRQANWMNRHATR